MDPIELNINSLIDDCLVNIFDYLSFEDKLKIDAVCKRWQCLNELSWKNVRRLDTGAIEFRNSNLIIKVIKKCGSYVNDLNIRIRKDSNYLEIFEEISKNCMNITKFSIEDWLKNNAERHYTDFHLGSLFKKNPKIYSITLLGLKLNGCCFLDLNSDLITEVMIHNCLFETYNYTNFFSELKNLKKFLLLEDNSDDGSNGIIDALNNGNCENIQDICLKNYNLIYSDKLMLFLHKQKKLLKLEFYSLSVKVDRHFFQNLSLDNIVYLKIHFDEDAANFSKALNNLENLNFGIKNLTDQFLDNLSINCKNLKTLKIHVQEKYSLTVNCENYFSRFHKLESFELFDFLETKQLNSNFDCLLKSLSHCQTLKVLLLVRSEITDTGATLLSSLLNLTDLDFNSSEITESQLIFILNNLHNLKKLKLINCVNIKSNLIFNLINNMKTLRQDEHILEIIFNPTNGSRNGLIFDDLPLLKIMYSL